MAGVLLFDTKTGFLPKAFFWIYWLLNKTEGILAFFIDCTVTIFFDKNIFAIICHACKDKSAKVDLFTLDLSEGECS